MAQPVLLKVYANLYPADCELAEKLENVATQAMPDEYGEIVTLEGELLKIMFEGIYFPVPEAIALIKKQLAPWQKGKLDVLDLEAWTLNRYIFEKGEIHHKSSPLNNVLAFSGH